MGNRIENMLMKLDIDNNRIRISMILAIVVLFITVASLSLPAVTLTKKELVLECPYEVHQHTKDCYEEIHDEHGQKRKKLICGYADYVVHMHNDNCFDKKGNLICDLPEIRKHVHDKECYEDKKVLDCGQKEGEDHRHTDECYTTKKVLTCGKEELHTHDEDCYDEDGKLVCGKLQLEQHQHGEKCLVEKEIEDTEEEFLTMEEITADAVITSEERSETEEETKKEAESFSDPSPDATTQKSSKDHSSREIFFLYEDEEDSAPEWAFEAETKYVAVQVKADQSAFPEGTTMSVQDVDDPRTIDAITGAVESEVKRIHAVDITFLDKNGKEIEPASPIRVTMSSSMVARADQPVVVHVDDKGKAELIELVDERELTKDRPEDAVVFDAERFSIYAIVETTIEKNVLASDGHNYKVSVTCGSDAGIPDGAELEVEELTDGFFAHGKSYEEYVAYTENTLGMKEGSAGYIRLFDIKIVKDGKKVQPLEGRSVDVRIELADSSSEELNVVHFEDGAKDGNVVESATEEIAEGTVVEFAADGFSVYAIVDAPEPVTYGDIATALFDLTSDRGVNGFYMSVGQSGSSYFTSKVNGNGALRETGSTTDAAVWYFEKVDGTDNRFHIYTEVDGEKKYIKQKKTNDNLIELSDEGSVFQAELIKNTSKFYIKLASEGRWLQHSNSGGGIRLYQGQNTPNNDQITLTFALSVEVEDDTYGLGGKTFGIAYNDESTKAGALMAQSKTVNKTQCMEAVDMLIRPDVLDNDGLLLVAQNSDITEWTFHSLSEDKYYITTEVDGQIKYLTINNANISLTDEPVDASEITATPGTGTNSGKWHFSVNGYSLNLRDGAANNGFNGATGTDTYTWLNLVTKSVLTDEDFNYYTAQKVSVSDNTNVYDSQQVVIYTRIWNDTTKRYEFYAVDYDGSLVRCYDTGDNIEWIGSQVNTALWDFTEYYNSDGTPNYYYELKNAQYGNYIAPQISGNQIMSENTIGVNLNGRRYGENYTTIIAWDDDNYAYTGLKTENGRVVACPLSEAEDFYFAVVKPAEATDHLTTVKTIDSDAYGISMKMIDFNNEIVNGRDSVQHAFFGAHENKLEKGLLSTNLTDGYPMTTNITGKEQPLSNLFKDMTDVNHLFIQSIYNESGYFEYDSTQNFATLLDADGNPGNTFTVYDQLAGIGTDNGNTRAHGQFMPYNNIQEGKLSNITNRTTVTQDELPDTDPRKGERLYSIPANEADYFFGMEMEASFTQTASGLDAWEHDIIFEFSGDDDFWLYVDGELILDLGGVASARTGSINFRTGVVQMEKESTTLYELFKKNYTSRGETDIEAKLAEIFTKNADGQWVFKDYTNHTMKMFYMERGAGASNLHMRFNLAAVKPGTFILNKKLSGTDNEANGLIEFPYQIYYESTKDGAYHLLGTKDGERGLVHYQGTNSEVKYAAVFPASGDSEESSVYQHVFFLKPGESAEVELPEDARNYYVVECGVNPGVYDQVSANGIRLTGKDSYVLSGRQDYETSEDTLANRSQVDFDNHVKEGAMRTLDITKKLYDVDGLQVLTYPDGTSEEHVDDTLFSFRLYLGNEFADADTLSLANLYSYYVKDPKGNYCQWDAAQQKFISLDINTYDALVGYFNDNNWTNVQKETVIFKTSMNGSISKIPTGYTVEVRDLIVGTHWKVEEPNNEIPKGYTLRLEDGYMRTDSDHEQNTKTTPISGTMQVDESPKVQVSNQKGWGLTVEKDWTDKDFMEIHDPIYFAVYVKDGEGGEESYALLENSVRQLKTSESEIYYFFGNLQSGIPFSNYVVREVTVTPLDGKDLLVDNETGIVTVIETTTDEDEETVKTPIATVTPIEDDGVLTIGGKPAGGIYHPVDDEDHGYAYTVTYTPGEQTTRNENVRTDIVTNSRPGIMLYKTDWSEDQNPVSGAVFTLQDADGKDVAAPAYTSGSDGLITIAYLSAGTYTLTETSAPKGYVVMEDPMQITIGENGKVTVGGVDERYYTISTENPDMAAVITIRNRPAALQVKKVDVSEKTPLKGAHFELYPQVTGTGGAKRKDYRPKPGYEDIVTDENGILEAISMDLGAGTYYLTETIAPEGYELLSEDLCFTIGDDGTVTINNEAFRGWLKSETDAESGNVSYVVTIPNGKYKEVEVKKISADTHLVLKGASFSLYYADEYDDSNNCPNNEDVEAILTGTSDEKGMLSLGPLSSGEYRLVETEAPKGYSLLDAPVKIIVSEDKVTAFQGMGMSNVTQSKKDGIWLIEVWNNPGFELPKTGGFGTTAFYILGASLVTLAGVLLVVRRRRDIL